MNDINLERYFRVAIRWIWLIVLATAIAAGVSYRVTKSMPRIYRTQTTLMVGDDVSNPRLSVDDITLSQRLADGYAAMVDRQSILEPTVQALHLPVDWRFLSTLVLVSHDNQSQEITILVTDTDPRRAAATANEIAHQLILQSPTQANVQQEQQRQQFVQQQLDALQNDIQQAQQDLQAKQASLGQQTSARDVLDTQDAIKADQDKITAWRTTYASLLGPSQGLPPNTLRVIDPAQVPTTPVSPIVRSNVLFASAAGFLVALGAILFIEYLNDTIDSVDDLVRATKIPLLGTVGKLGKIAKPTDTLVTIHSTRSASAEAYRFLRTSLQFAHADKGTAPLIVTSPAEGEGKSVTSANLAVCFAQAGKRVILVDADLRNPSLASYFGVQATNGLSTLLQERLPDDDLRARLGHDLLATEMPGLLLLPSGSPPTTVAPSELLASAEMKQVLATLQTMADVVILDTPPVLPVADTVSLGGLDDGIGIVLVVELGKSRFEAVKLALDSLEAAGARVLGTVANKAAGQSRVRYRSSYPAQPKSNKQAPGALG